MERGSVRPGESAASEDRERLARQLAEVVEQQEATSEVLAAIGETGADLRSIFETVLRHAVRLCRAGAGIVYELEGDAYRATAVLGGSPAYQEFVRNHPVQSGPGSLIGRVTHERRTVLIDDAATDPNYEWHEAQHVGGFRSMLGVPMVVDDRVLGVLAVWRTTVEPFDDTTVRLVTTLAAQGAIALRNVGLLRTLEQRSDELERSVEGLQALAEVGRALSSSLDLDEVLQTIVTRAVELSDADGGSIFEFDAGSGRFELRTCFGTTEDCVEALRTMEVPLEGSLVGSAALAGAVRQAPDLDAEPSDPHVDALRAHGWRSMVAVPLRREQEIVGALIVRRHRRWAVPPETVGLLEALATQSAAAIHNARIYRELARKSAELEVASRHKSEFLASMSHELRTPLNAVIGFSDILLDRMFGELNERQDEYIRDIRDSGRHLLELINEILDLSKIEAGRMELEPGPVWLPDVLRNGLAMVRDRALTHGIALDLDVAPEIGEIQADELRLKQVVLNLLSNAVKFTPDGGSVAMSARLGDGCVEVSVRDTGVGIPEADRRRIFEAFQRGDRGARSSVEGTGLGLTLSRRIVELHGGRIWMDSVVGEGSTFSFVIPAAPAPSIPAPAAPPPALPEGATVLVVEDDERSADLMRVLLERAGYAVVVARDGAEGLELARRLAPEAVVLDILLPRINGWELLARLKGDPATAAIPVVVVSMLDERGAGFALGAAEYLVKPVDQERLLGALARCAAAPSSGRTAVAIDDAVVDLDLVEAALRPNGWTVLRATSGEEGVQLVLRERPAVVLVDLLMPGLDGFAVVERLRGDPAAADVPIVVLTSKDMTAADNDRLRGRISALAQKGTFRQAELVELVERLARARLAEAPR